jgi:hypothetical protein
MTEHTQPIPAGRPTPDKLLVPQAMDAAAKLSAYMARVVARRENGERTTPAERELMNAVVALGRRANPATIATAGQAPG